MRTTVSPCKREALLKGLLRGDRRIMNRFYEQLWRRSRAFIVVTYGAHCIPVLEEAFHPALLVLLKRISTPGFINQNLEAFAFGIVRLTFLDYLKRRNRHKIVYTADALPEPEAGPEPAYHTAADLFAHHDHWRLYHWYYRLPHRERQLLDWRVQGYTSEEMAGMLEMTHGGVRNIFSKLLKQARELQ